MDVPPEYRASQTKSGHKRRSKGSKNQQRQQAPNAFDMQNQQQQQFMQNLGQPDMFYGEQFYPPGMYRGQQFGIPPYPGQQFLSDPVANMAMQYGQTLAGHGKDLVNQNIQKYVASSKLKYYFAVDTAYVGKKLGLLFFPYTHADWSIHYNQDEPVAPRYEINAPDLYIPVMAFVTYILVAGMALGIQGRFSPEQLGVQASSALVWLIIELMAFSLSLYIMNLNTGLTYLDIIAYCGYKFVGMTISILAGIGFSKTFYYAVLLWFCFSLVFYLMRALRVQVMPYQGDDGFTKGAKRSLYLIMSMSLVQPILMWWLTSYVMVSRKAVV